MWWHRKQLSGCNYNRQRFTWQLAFANCPPIAYIGIALTHCDWRFAIILPRNNPRQRTSHGIRKGPGSTGTHSISARGTVGHRTNIGDYWERDVYVHACLALLSVGVLVLAQGTWRIPGMRNASETMKLNSWIVGIKYSYFAETTIIIC